MFFLFVQLVVNLNQLSIPIVGNTGGSDQEDVPDIRMILLVLAGGLIMGGALLFYLKLPMVKCMSGTKSDVGAPLIFDPEVEAPQLNRMPLVMWQVVSHQPLGVGLKLNLLQFYSLELILN